MELLEKQILNVVEDYKKTKSIKTTALNLKLSTGTVRKMLITAGGWGNRLSTDISILRREHPELDNSEIAQRLKISLKTVQLYSPYESMRTLTLSHDNTNPNDENIIDSGECGDKAEWILSKSGKLIISGTGPMWDYDGICYGMERGPRPKWWSRRDGIQVKEVIVEQGITTIGQYAFSGLIDLNSVSLPDTICEIKGGAFCGENHVKSFVVPKGVNYIAWDTFYSNVLLEEIFIPSGVYKIQTYAFHACMSLRRMYFEGDCPRIASSTFDMCPEGAITVYHKEGARGFGEIWNGFRTEVF